MDTTIEASQSGGLATKPSPPPKPSLAPKPFSLQKNSTIRSIKAPKTVSKTAHTPNSETSQTKKLETKSFPTTTVTTPAEKLPQPISSPETTLKTDPTPNPEATEIKKSETKSPRTTAVTIPTEELSQLISSSETALKTAPTAEPKTSQTEKSETKSSPTTTVTTPAEKLPQPISSPETVLKTDPTPNPEATQTKKSESRSPRTTAVIFPTKELSQPISSSETAPKTAPTLNSETNQIEQSETENPSAVTIPAKKRPQPTSTSTPKPQSASVLPKSHPEASKTNETLQQIENSLGAETAALDPATETAPTKEEPKSEPAQEDIIQTSHEPPTIAVASSERKDGEEKQSDAPVSVSQNIEEPSSNSSTTNDSFYQRGSVRKRLPKALTSKFESGGIPLPRQSFRAIPKPITKDESNKPESSDAQHVHTTPEPLIKESDTDAEDFTGGNSIKKRISLLFDSVSKPEVTTKREEPEIVNGIRGVKEQIKNWASETGPEDQKVEKSPQAADGVCSKALKPETPRVEVPAAEETPTQPVDSRSTVSSHTGSEIEPPKEEPFKDKPFGNATETPAETDKSKEDDVQDVQRADVQSSQLAASDEKHLAELKRKKKKNRRSVRFGTVVADDGTPPVVLGPDPESSEDDKQEDNAQVESKKKGEDSVSMPVYRRIGTLQRKSDETQSQETLMHQQTEEESEHPRSKMEEEFKHMKDEDAREKEKARDDELERKRLEEERRETEMELLRQKQVQEERQRERVRLEEEQRKEARMREERERQWQKDEEERLKLEEHQRQKEEEERKRKELEEQRQKELKDEEERLKLEEDQRQKEEEERRKYEQRRMELERMRKEEEERLRQEELEKERLRQELEREQVRRQEEKERMRQEDEERNRRELERKMQQEKEEEEERRKYEQRRMELERMKKEEEDRLRQEELEKEKLRQELERKMQQEKEEEERKRKEEIKLQMEKEMAEELKKKMEESQPRTAEEQNKREEKLIEFDAEEPPASPSSHVSKNTESPVDVVYDDFSIQNPVLDVDFDDFSVKPRRRTFQPRRETAPISSDWRVEPLRKDNLLVSFDSKPLETQQENEPKQPETMLVPTRVPEIPEEEKVKRLLAEFGVKEEGDGEAENPVADQPVEMKEEEEMENVAEMKDKGEEKDNIEVNSHITNDEDKLIQTLLRNQQDGFSEQTSGPDSPTHVPDPDPVPEASEDLDNTDSQREMDLDAVCENSAPLLDNSSQKSKVVLGRRLTRTRPSRSLRLESAEAARVRLSVYDDEKDNQSDSEEEPPKSKPVYSSPSSTQRVAMFPGLSPADLLSGLKRKTGGVAAKAEERSAEDRGEQETESQNKKVAPSQVSGSPRLAANLVGATRVLPPAVGKDGGLWPKKRTTQQKGET